MELTCVHNIHERNAGGCGLCKDKRISELNAKLSVYENPQKFDEVWIKYCELENIDPDNASGIKEIGASFIYGAGFVEGLNYKALGEGE